MNNWQKTKRRNGWHGGIADWVEDVTANLSVVFSWNLPGAYQRAVWYKPKAATETGAIKKERCMWYKRHEDDEWFDEIRFETADGPLLRIVIVPRYKTSDMSGDEWRISARIQVARGKIWSDFDTGYHDLEDAAKGLYPGFYTSHPELHEIQTVSIDFYRKGTRLYESTYDGKPLAFLHAAGHLPWALVLARENTAYLNDWHNWCFQPGCSSLAVSTYRLKMEYCRQGHATVPSRETGRRFCGRHLRRGDCGLEDADENYEVVEGLGPDQASGWEEDESPSIFGGFIDLSQSSE